jgi:hypothetical protein
MALFVKPDSDDQAVVSTGVASEDNDVFGVTQTSTGAAGDSVSVLHLNCVASFKITASGAISKNAKVYTGADGKATATATSLTYVGKAREAATADGDIIQVLRTIGSNDDIS